MLHDCHAEFSSASNDHFSIRCGNKFSMTLSLDEYSPIHLVIDQIHRFSTSELRQAILRTQI